MRVLLVGGPLTGHLYDINPEVMRRGQVEVTYLADAQHIITRRIKYKRTSDLIHEIPVFKAIGSEPKKIQKTYFDPKFDPVYASDNVVYQGHTPLVRVDDGKGLSKGAVAYLTGKIARGIYTGTLFEPETLRAW